MLLILKSLFFLILSFSAFAENTAEFIENIVQKSHEKMEDHLQEAQKLDEEARLSVKNVLEPTQAINPNSGCGCQRILPVAIEENHSGKVLIFISFSMPRTSLQSLFREAEQHGATLVMQGLKNNSFVETAETIKTLKIGIQIDPNLFEKYQIKTVPTFVLVNEHEDHFLRGNVSLSYALAKFKEEL